MLLIFSEKTKIIFRDNSCIFFRCRTDMDHFALLSLPRAQGQVLLLYSEIVIHDFPMKDRYFQYFALIQ